MFAFVLRSPSIYTLMIVRPDGREEPVPQRLLMPLTRLNLSQYIYKALNDQHDLAGALGWLVPQIHQSIPEAVSIKVVKLEVDVNSNAIPHYKIKNVEVLDALPLR